MVTARVDPLWFSAGAGLLRLLNCNGLTCEKTRLRLLRSVFPGTGFVAYLEALLMRSAGSIDMSTRRIRTLVMSLEYPNRASYYSDWRDAFCGSRDFACQLLNILDLRPKRLRSMIEEYDAIVLLHSCNSDTLDYLAPLTQILVNRRS